MPPLAAQPGARVVVEAGTQSLNSELLERFVGLREAQVGQVVVSGRDLSRAGPKTLRRLVGYAAQGMMLVRGSVSRTVRYRCPNAGPEELDRLLSGQVCKFVGGWSERGVSEVEAGGAVKGVFGQACEGAGGQDGVFVSVFAGQVHREAPAGG